MMYENEPSSPPPHTMHIACIYGNMQATSYQVLNLVMHAPSPLPTSPPSPTCPLPLLSLLTYAQSLHGYPPISLSCGPPPPPEDQTVVYIYVQFKHG